MIGVVAAVVVVYVWGSVQEQKTPESCRFVLTCSLLCNRASEESHPGEVNNGEERRRVFFFYLNQEKENHSANFSKLPQVMDRDAEEAKDAKQRQSFFFICQLACRAIFTIPKVY